MLCDENLGRFRNRNDINYTPVKKHMQRHSYRKEYYDHVNGSREYASVEAAEDAAMDFPDGRSTRSSFANKEEEGRAANEDLVQEMDSIFSKVPTNRQNTVCYDEVESPDGDDDEDGNDVLS